MPISRRFALPAISALALLAAACGSDKSDPSPWSSSAPDDSAGVPMSQGETETPMPLATDETATAPQSRQPIACASEIGAHAAGILAAQCKAVSPATRPPCNTANSCAMIRNEVARGCAILGEDAKQTPECALDPVSREAAADLVVRYYSAINAHDYASAWTLWGENGGTSGKTLVQFENGFARTSRTHVDIGKVSDVEGGAGSIYVTVPVSVDAELEDGTRQRFTGEYALRQINRGMGISQGWHIMTAKLKAVR